MIFLMLTPIYAVAVSDIDFTNQMLDSEIERLTKQRDEKFAALQKCEETTKGFKIAGITTLAATGVGIYGNIKLADKLRGKNNTGGRNSVAVIDNRSQEEKNEEGCELLCDLGAAPSSCGC